MINVTTITIKGMYHSSIVDYKTDLLKISCGSSISPIFFLYVNLNWYNSITRISLYCVLVFFIRIVPLLELVTVRSTLVSASHLTKIYLRIWVLCFHYVV